MRRYVQTIATTVLGVTLLAGCSWAGKVGPDSEGAAAAKTGDGLVHIWCEADPDDGVAPLNTEIKCEPLGPVEGEIKYTHDFRDGSSGKGASVKHTFKKPGQYRVTTTAVDASGNLAHDEVIIDVEAPE